MSWLDIAKPPGPCPLCNDQGCKLCGLFDEPSPKKDPELRFRVPAPVAEELELPASHVGRQAVNVKTRSVALSEAKKLGKKRRAARKKR